MTNTIHVITEGATERQVCRILYQKDILSQKAKPRNERWRSLFKDLESEGYEQVIAKLRGEEGYLESLRRVSDGRQLALLVFDQEDLAAPRDRATKLAEKLRWNEPFWDKFDFQPVEGVENLFEHPSSTLHLVLHVSNASIAGIDRRDFDGYLLQLLQGEYKEEIAREFVSAKKTSDLLRKAEEEISRLMETTVIPGATPNPGYTPTSRYFSFVVHMSGCRQDRRMHTKRRIAQGICPAYSGVGKVSRFFLEGERSMKYDFMLNILWHRGIVSRRP